MKVTISVLGVSFLADRLAVLARFDELDHTATIYIGRGPSKGLAIVEPPSTACGHPLHDMLDGMCCRTQKPSRWHRDDEAFLLAVLTKVREFLQRHPVLPTGPARMFVAVPDADGNGTMIQHPDKYGDAAPKVRP